MISMILGQKLISMQNFSLILAFLKFPLFSNNRPIVLFWSIFPVQNQNIRDPWSKTGPHAKFQPNLSIQWKFQWGHEYLMRSWIFNGVDEYLVRDWSRSRSVSLSRGRSYVLTNQRRCLYGYPGWFLTTLGGPLTIMKSYILLFVNL